MNKLFLLYFVSSVISIPEEVYAILIVLFDLSYLECFYFVLPFLQVAHVQPKHGELRLLLLTNHIDSSVDDAIFNIRSNIGTNLCDKSSYEGHY